MAPRLRPLNQQVLVITGASSGIGLATARIAAERGATVVLSSRNERALQHIASNLADQGHKASFVTADTSREEDMQRLADTAIAQHGAIDSWINAAAVPLYGEILDVPMADHRRLFDVNYWGVVNGSLAAIRAMEKRGGALINIGSVLSDVHVPLQGPYVASKHAVKGFTDCLRVELERRGLPISVTLIKPTGIDTPYADHARSYLPRAPVTPPPRYVPRIVANAILHACEHPKREIYVGGGGAALVMMRRLAPWLYDFVNRRFMYDLQMTDRPLNADSDTRDNLYAPKADGAERGRAAEGVARETSLYTQMQLHPWIAWTMLGGAFLLGRKLVENRRQRRLAWF
jgi:NAD(P)-dependent dehydrogenase (short-subunit alcohol dehydrogenase family)